MSVKRFLPSQTRVHSAKLSSVLSSARHALGLALLAPLLVVAACSFSVDRGAANFSCRDEQCPSGFDCVAELCVPTGTDAPDADTVDAAPDATPPDDASAPDGGPGVCGDGNVNDGEECDDGNGVTDDACTNACRFAICGDSIFRNGVENCSPGAPDCTNRCFFCGEGGRDLENGNCYTSIAATSWASARTFCENKIGRHLLVLDDVFDPDAMARLSVTEVSWIGLVAPTTWITGMPLASPNWAAGEPVVPPSPSRPGMVEANGAMRVAPDATTLRPAVCEEEPWFASPIDNHVYVVDWREVSNGLAAEDRCRTIGATTAILQGGTMRERGFLAFKLPPGRYCVRDGGPGTCRTLVVTAARTTTLEVGCACRPLCEHE